MISADNYCPHPKNGEGNVVSVFVSPRGRVGGVPTFQLIGVPHPARVGYPPPPGRQQHSEYLLCSGLYASCGFLQEDNNDTGI